LLQAATHHLPMDHWGRDELTTFILVCHRSRLPRNVHEDLESGPTSCTLTRREIDSQICLAIDRRRLGAACRTIRPDTSPEWLTCVNRSYSPRLLMRICVGENNHNLRSERTPHEQRLRFGQSAENSKC
jgi:hypothetical protein